MFWRNCAFVSAHNECKQVGGSDGVHGELIKSRNTLEKLQKHGE